MIRHVHEYLAMFLGRMGGCLSNPGMEMALNVGYLR
jgi:hypothetical protein